MSAYDASLFDLLKGTIHDAQDLVRSEIALARTELRDEIGRLRDGAIALTAAAVLGLVAVVFLLTALAWAIPAAARWPAWTGFAIVGALVLAPAVVIGTKALRRLNGRQHMPHTVETMKENMRWMRARTS